MKKKLRELLADETVTVDVVSRHAEISRFSREVFGEDLDFSDINIPADPGGYGWALPIPKGMTLNRAWAAAKSLFPPCYSYLGDDLDSVVPGNERTPANGTYVIRVRDRVEADEELKNRSADWIAKEKLSTMTLLERIILELWYFWKFKKHLDIQNVTLCAGSRSSGGGVPSAYCYDDRFKVYWYYPDNSDDNLRARAVVS